MPALLQELKEALANIEQENEPMLRYRSLVNHLASDDFIKTKDSHVAIRLAICIAELLRLLAPLNPFDEIDRMKVNL